MIEAALRACAIRADKSVSCSASYMGTYIHSAQVDGNGDLWVRTNGTYGDTGWIKAAMSSVSYNMTYTFLGGILGRSISGGGGEVSCAAVWPAS